MASDKLFTWGDSNVDSLLTTVREAILRSGDFLHDQVFTKVTLLNWLESKARVTKKGGASLLVPLLFGKNGSVAAYSKDDIIDTSGTEGLTMSLHGTCLA